MAASIAGCCCSCGGVDDRAQGAFGLIPTDFGNNPVCCGSLNPPDLGSTPGCCGSLFSCGGFNAFGRVWGGFFDEVCIWAGGFRTFGGGEVCCRAGAAPQLQHFGTYGLFLVPQVHNQGLGGHHPSEASSEALGCDTAHPGCRFTSWLTDCALATYHCNDPEGGAE